MKRTSLLLVALSAVLTGLSGCVAYPVGHSDYPGDRAYQRDGDRDHDRDRGRDQRDGRGDRHDDNRSDDPNCDPRLPDCRRH